jgi:hypothetical protein
VTVILTDHARSQAKLRGATLAEIEAAIQDGEESTAKRGRTAFRKNFTFRANWKGIHYETKQVMPMVVREGDDSVVITVYVFYFGGRQ